MAAVVGARTILAETIGAKLRRLSAVATGRNAIELPPLLKAPDWAASTAYSEGMLVRNAGNLYVCVTRGVSAPSSGPTTTGHGDAVADGAAAWTLYGASEPSGDDPLAPAYVLTDVNPDAALPHAWAPATYPGSYRLFGSYPVVDGTDWSPHVFAEGPSVVARGRGASFGFVTDAPILALVYGSDSPGLGVTINGRYLSLGATPILTGTRWHILDFSSAGGRREREFRVWGGKDDAYFRGVQLGPADCLYPPHGGDEILAAFIGDSIWAGSGYGPMLPGRMLPGIVGQLLGWSDPWNLSSGGTGFLAADGGDRYSYRQRLPEIIARNPDIWILAASRNDAESDAAAITAEAILTLRAIRAASRAPIVVVGLPMSKNVAEAPAIRAVEDAVSAAVTQSGDPLGQTFFIPVQTDPASPWITGVWTDDVRGGLANAGFYIGGDGIHPVDAGTLYLGRRIAGAIRKNVLPRLR